DGEEAPAVVGDLELGAREVDPERVPGAGRHRDLDAVSAGRGTHRSEIGAVAPDDLVGDDVVLERVRAGDIVVVPVAPSPHHPAGPILAPRHRLEPRLHPAVAIRRALAHRPPERGPALVGECLALAGPARGAAAG